MDAVKEMTRELRSAITQSGEKMAEKVEDMVVEFAGLFGATVDMSSVSAGTAENVLKAMGIQVSMSHLEVRIGDSMHLQQDRMQWIASMWTCFDPCIGGGEGGGQRRGHSQVRL